MRRLALVAALGLLLVPAARASEQHPTLAELEGQVMCPVCHTTLDQSDSSAARRIEAFIQTRIEQCATADQIKSELVANFGAGILAAPPHKGFDLLAWWLPLGGIVVAALLVAFGVWRWTRSRDDDPPPPDTAEDPETERRLDELLARLD